MNHVRWIAWGVIELEKLERMQRRNYIKKIREDVTPLGIKFDCGGTSSKPWYQVTLPIALKGAEKKHAVGGDGAAKKVCTWLLMELGNHEQQVDGVGRELGVADAGDQTTNAVSDRI